MSQQVLPPLDVVCALLVRGQKLYVTLRFEHVDEPATWEFPGGKVEPGEDHATALVRECREELGVDIDVGALAWHLKVHRPKQDLWLSFYHARMSDPQGQQPQPLEAQEGAWVTAQELLGRVFCRGDQPMLEAIASGKLKVFDAPDAPDAPGV